MTERNVTVIPATKGSIHRVAGPAAKKRRVAGYARVSTDKDEQFTSYEAQVDYYTQLIKSRADWEFVKVYTDEGISGLGMKKRDGFKEMIDAATAGSIDLIITKSVSRFARNTVDSLVTIRKLKDKGVEVYFEKVGYLMGEPVQYVNRGNGDDTKLSDAINTLNEFVFAEDKAAKDKELADWFTICGTAFRIILPDPHGEEDEAPFEIYTLDPRNAFVVYHSGLGNKPMMGVRYVTCEDGKTIYSVYTKNKYFEIAYDGVLDCKDLTPLPDVITKEEDHIYGDIPIVEYPANSARLGAFEIVLPLLDALNNVSSNRLDGVEQFIQSLLILKGVDIESEEYKALKENGGLKVPIEGDAYYLTQELNQTQTQTLVDYMYQTILVICGMPNRNGGSSTSDTGSAVIMRDGWSDAEARAKDTELMFKMSEKRFLRLAIEFANTYRNLDLKLSQIEIRFTRRNYENIQAKAQVLTTLLANDKIHPRLAFEHCGLFVDPDLAYTQSKEYAEERKAEAQRELEMFAQKKTIEGQENAEDEEDETGAKDK